MVAPVSSMGPRASALLPRAAVPAHVAAAWQRHRRAASRLPCLMRADRQPPRSQSSSRACSRFASHFIGGEQSPLVSASSCWEQPSCRSRGWSWNEERPVASKPTPGPARLSAENSRCRIPLRLPLTTASWPSAGPGLLRLASQNLRAFGKARGGRLFPWHRSS